MRKEVAADYYEYNENTLQFEKLKDSNIFLQCALKHFVL